MMPAANLLAASIDWQASAIRAGIVAGALVLWFLTQ